MHLLLGLSAVLPVAIAAAVENAYTLYPSAPFPPPGPPVLLTTTTVDNTWVVTCPAPPTVFVNVTATEYFPVTATTTDTLPITVIQTIISTTVLTTTDTVTAISTTPTTATATEIISIYDVTIKGTSITVCPTRIANPTYTAAGPYPTDWTWGCPPGWLCKPVFENCNFEAGLPDRNFLCSPNECIPAEVIPAILPTWDTTIYGNSTPDTDPSLTVSTIDDFFNMNPEQFGLTYEIFEYNEVFEQTTTILLPPSPTLGARQAQTSIPGACYPWCNNCLLEAQSGGKTSALCVPGSAFEVSLTQCEQCIDYHKNDNTASFVEIAPQFQQFLDYCEQFATVVVSTTITATTTNGVGSSYSLVTGTLSTTVTPKASVAASTIPSPSPSKPTTVVTVVASTATLTPVSPTKTSVVSPVSTSTSTSLSTATVTPPAPISSEKPYTTTETIVTTTYSHSTVSGTAWNSITIIIPMGVNSTSIMYGSELTAGNATLVIPTNPVTSSYTTTMVVTPGEFAASTTVATGGAAAASTLGNTSTTGSASTTPSSFTGAAWSLRISAGQTTLFGLLAFMAVVFVL